MSISVEHPEDATVENIRSEMSRLRSEIRIELDDVASHAKELTDWHYYVRQAPLVSMAVAVGVGFVIVPSRSKSDSNSSSLKPNFLSRSKTQETVKATESLGRMAMRLIAATALRQALVYATNQFSRHNPGSGS